MCGADQWGPAADDPGAGGCERDITQGLANNTPATDNGLPFYNNQVIQQYLDRDTNPATDASSSATVTVPPGAQAVYADLMWEGTSEKSPNPDIDWDPSIYTQPMEVSIDDDQHYQSITPDRGTSIEPGSPASDTNDYYYTASADITSLVAGQTGEITLWGADAPFPADGFNQAGLAWDVVVVYQYPGVDLAAGDVGKQITVQDGFVYQNASAAPTNTVVNVPSITDPTDVQVGLIAGEGDVGITGDTFAIDGQNIPHPVTGQTDNFFVSYAQNVTDPDWTSNFSTDDISWTLAPGIVQAGATSMTLTTQTSGDGYVLRGLTTAVPVPSIGLTKSVDPTYTTVGAPLVYTFTVTNTSAVTIHDLSVDDPLFGGAIASCANAGDLAPAASYTCTATHTITLADIAAGQIDNTATANGFGENDAALTNTASAVTTTSTNLVITKTGAPKPVHVGDPFSYTMTVENVGPADAADVIVTDPLPAGLANPTATATDGATVAISDGTLTATQPLLTYAAPNSFTVTVSGTIAATFTGDTITNTASVTAPNTNCVPPSQDPANCTSTDDTDVLQPAPITITKVADNVTPLPGATFTYTVEVDNGSATTTATATVSDLIPADLTDATWTCAASTGSTCSFASGTGDISDVEVSLSPQGVATFAITVTVAADFQGGTIANTATATPGQYTVCADDPAATSCSADSSVISTPEPAPLIVEKSHTPIDPSPPPGAAITYTVTVTNSSASTIAHGTFDDPVPAQIDDTGGTWTTAVTGTGTAVTPDSGTGFPTGQIITLEIAPGGTVTFTIAAHVDLTYDGSNVTNIATVTPGLNTSCEDGEPTCQAVDSFVEPAQLFVEKTHTLVLDDPSVVTYTVTVTNPVSGAVGMGTFSDPLPSQVDETTATWTCAAEGTGSACPSPPDDMGTGSPTDVSISVGSNGGTVTFTITANIPRPVAVDIINTAQVTPGANTECGDPASPCEATDEFTFTPPAATIAITKDHTVQGQDVTYTLVVTNTSDTTQAEGTVTDEPLSPALGNVTWTADATGGASVATASGSGPIQAIAVVLPVGGEVTFTVVATILSDWAGGMVTNTAVVSPGANTVCDPDADPSCAATSDFSTPSLITITKTIDRTHPLPPPGGEVTYRVVVTNLSDDQEATATISDPLPAELDSAGAKWETETTGTGTAATPASGTGPITDVAITLSPEGEVTFTITAAVLATFPGGNITNTATAMPGELTACQNADPVCTASASFTSDPPPAALAIGKSASSGTKPLPPGTTVTYTITVTNTTTTTIGHATVADPTPAGLLAGSWTATATAESTVIPSSATGPIAGAQVTVAPSGRVTFTLTARIDPTFDGTFNITNVATLTLGANTVCAPTDPGQACDASAVVAVITPSPPRTPPTTPTTKPPELAAKVTPTTPATVSPSPGELPVTGINAETPLRVAVLLLLLGGVLVCAGRRRPNRQ